MVKDYSLGGKIPEIAEIINTDQFKISEEILDTRFEKGLSFAEAVQVVGLSREKYIKFEYGDIDISLSEYRNVLRKLKDYNPQFSFKEWKDRVDWPSQQMKICETGGSNPSTMIYNYDSVAQLVRAFDF